MDVIEKQYKEMAVEQAELFQSMSAIMHSDHGENFARLINALVDGFKETALFTDEERDRLIMRGAVVGLNTLLSQVVEFASRSDEIGEKDVKLADMVPSYATITGDDEL